EDGIRDSSVTGVQTCALPISAVGLSGRGRPEFRALRSALRSAQWRGRPRDLAAGDPLSAARAGRLASTRCEPALEQVCPAATKRSEERRVGKEGRDRGVAGAE